MDSLSSMVKDRACSKDWANSVGVVAWKPGLGEGVRPWMENRMEWEMAMGMGNGK